MTFPSVAITGIWDSELIAALPKSLLFCAHNGAGYNQVDVHACSARDPPIRVSNVPKLADDATADTAVFLILGALRNFNSSLFALRQGQWRTTPEPPALGHDPRGKVLGILGMGGIGRNLMRKCEVFGFKTVYHNRSKLSEEMAGGAEWVGFDELLARADVLSLNLPLNVSPGRLLFGCFCLFRIGLRGADLRNSPPEKHPPHDLRHRIRKDEARRRDHQHGPRRRHGRKCPRRGPGERASVFGGPGRFRRRTQSPSGFIGEPKCDAFAAYGDLYGGDDAEDGGVDDWEYQECGRDGEVGESGSGAGGFVEMRGALVGL